jgi:serine/threonine protein kinase
MERERGCLRDESIVAFLDGRLNPDARASVERHVDACAACGLLILPTGSRSGPRRGAIAHALGARDLVAGRYRVERLVGGGGMGEVYAVLDEHLGERIALKTVRATIADDPRAIARLKSEVQLARRVTHPNVCRIYDLGTEASQSDGDGQLAFLTMELLRGRTLAEEIRRHGVFPEQVACKVMRQLVAGLAAAHQAGVIHKDFKSDNVMLVAPTDSADVRVDDEARAVITDFGLAAPEAFDVPWQEGRFEFSGTPGYIAPERLLGSPATAASDVYSLGIVLLDMLEGRVAVDPVRATRRTRSGSGVDLFGLALGCCEPRPEARPSLDTLAATLRGMEHRPPRRSVRTTRVSLAGAVFAAVVALSVRSWTAVSPPSTSEPDRHSTASEHEPRARTIAPPMATAASAVAFAPAAPERLLPSTRHHRKGSPPVAGLSQTSPENLRQLTSAASGDASVQHDDEPIRSLGGIPRRALLGGNDDAPINPFVSRR